MYEFGVRNKHGGVLKDAPKNVLFQVNNAKCNIYVLIDVTCSFQCVYMNDVSETLNKHIYSSDSLII